MRCVCAGVLSCLLAVTASAALADGTVAERRAAVLAAEKEGAVAIPALVKALDDESALVRRAAIRVLAGFGAPAQEALRQALGNSDFLVRRTALTALGGLMGAAALPLLETGLKDPQPEVRLAAVTQLIAMKPRSQEVIRLLTLAKKDASPEVSGPAAQTLWPFYKIVVPLRERPEALDHEVKLATRVPLPKEGWRFKPDPDQDGHNRKWFDPAFDDASWALIPIEQSWQQSGQSCQGYAWYRKSFDLPAPKPDCDAVEIRFNGVDEAAWVWVNGEYVGQQDIGAAGWDRPFSLDVTNVAKWGATNQITVRVEKLHGQHAGIWQPVAVEALKVLR